MPLGEGAQFAGYTVGRLLGIGGMGEVYAVRHPRLPRLEALKILRTDVSADTDYQQRFNREAELAGSLWHPHIVGVHDRGEFEGQLWISTEYVEGSDAAEVLGDGHLDGMPPRMVIEIVSAIADALDYAHDRGVLHRYVNPGNILVSNAAADRQRIALTLIGVARPDAAHNTLTLAGMFMGTAGYTPTE